MCAVNKDFDREILNIKITKSKDVATYHFLLLKIHIYKSFTKLIHKALILHKTNFKSTKFSVCTLCFFLKTLLSYCINMFMSDKTCLVVQLKLNNEAIFIH